MAVYKQTYSPYEGPMRGDRWRFAILTRYSFLSVFESRMLVVFFALCFVPPLLAAGLLYASHNARAMASLSSSVFGEAISNLQVNNSFFTAFFRAQAFLSFLLVTFVGPGLVSSDFANSALVVYLSKPFSRAEYVAGRLTVLLSLTSAVTWIPATILMAVQTDLEGYAWLSKNYRIAAAFLVTYWLWIAAISLLALAVSALVKWRPFATGCMLILFFAGAGFGVMTNQILELREQWGLLFSLDSSISMVFDWLMGGMPQRGGLSAWIAMVWLLGLCVVCAAMLSKKLRAYEVVQ